MGRSKAARRQLQILDNDISIHQSEQLDLLSFVSDYSLVNLGPSSEKNKPVPEERISRIKKNYGNVDRNKTFHNFCTGDSNIFAVESIKRFLFNEHLDLNLFFLKAGSGLGKTHILHAVANELILRKKTFYLSSPLTMSILFDQFHVLKNYDYLLIDDLDEVEKNTELQKIFCQLFDLAQSGAIKMILCGSKNPKDFDDCQERFKGKLSASLIHHISGVNKTLALDIVQMKSKLLKLDLSNSVRDFISTQLEFNVYGIESLLQQLKTISELRDLPLTVGVVRKEISSKEKQLGQSFRPLLMAVANAFDLSVEQLLSTDRKKDLVQARHAAMYLLKEKENLNIMKVASIFGKDHSSVIYAIEKMKKEIQQDLRLKKNIEKIISDYERPASLACGLDKA